MLLKPRTLAGQSFLVAALVTALGGFGIAQAADVGAAAAGAGVQVPKTPVAPLSVPTPTKPMTMPSTSTPTQMVPKAATPTTTTATTATTATTNMAGNPDGSCPESAPVKVSRSKIYHVPEGRNYSKTKAKYCFANAAAAEQAGFRAPKK